MKKVLFIFGICYLLIFSQESIKKENVDLNVVIQKLNDLEKRINEIEKKIKNIEETTKELKKSLRNLQISVPSSPEVIKVSEEDWKLIKRGMKKEDVTNILGLPNVIQTEGGQIEVWLYYGMGKIFFTQDRVIKIETDRNLSPPTIIK